ncbi:(2Fe-2S)-binding protein [Paractinoplanes atraurantiacus]|uniref:Carbon-monoxide dehydrogenase small subunit/2-furoyl-CoA dehydrogenase 2Fe-2S iron sulfur subunit n=1 Tax=Paractinoplanes atraurantiacus TaxID=1036182 RepID=A0A285J044_9ACTN|nr:2Fe-2S iron-sulfur cluster-binding protein [Actinoplanes atraurantiacus]SNY53588.1 carbon-monoxide dehydrogenase small subunit/2-furoyl-CoA dehydrogenase 2Fe-2S iron sulfur subunit [Actinoplanes atraurantiacus]
MTATRAPVVLIDGVAAEVAAPPMSRVAWWLRDNGCPAVKVGCEEGSCGACMILLDGEAVPSCLLPVGRLADGARIETSAALTEEPDGAEIVRSLAEESAVQCGFCTPGIVVSCVAAARSGDDLSEAGTTRAVLSSHVCRCTGYQAIVRSVTRAAATLAAVTPVAAAEGI